MFTLASCNITIKRGNNEFHDDHKKYTAHVVKKILGLTPHALYKDYRDIGVCVAKEQHHEDTGFFCTMLFIHIFNSDICFDLFTAITILLVVIVVK